MEPVNPLKSFSLANAATPAILFRSLVDDPQAVRQDLKATEAFTFLREALRHGAHPCMAGVRGTSIDELRRNVKYIRALLSGYSINSSASEHDWVTLALYEWIFPSTFCHPISCEVTRNFLLQPKLGKCTSKRGLWSSSDSNVSVKEERSIRCGRVGRAS